jgi:hypothetical protein
MNNRAVYRWATLTFAIAAATAMLFTLQACKPSSEPTTADNASSASSPAAGAPSIKAVPNPIPADGDGKTMISWDTGDGSVGQIWVSVNGAEQKLFAQEVKGSAAASWIAAGESADFVLYAGTNREKEIARVKVTHNK